MAEEDGRGLGDGRSLQASGTPELFRLLLAAASVPAAAACGLTPALAASYCELLDGLPAEQRAAKARSC